MHKVLVTDPLNEVGLNILKEAAEVDYKPGLSPSELLDCIENYSALLIRSGTTVTKDVVEKCSAKMQIIGRAGVGVDNVDIDSATNKGILVVNSPDGNTTAAAEHTIAMMMALSRQIAPADASMKSGKWQRKKFLGIELRKKVLGVIGLGKIGSKVARVAQSLGMEILAFDPVVTEDKAKSLNIKLVDLEEIWAKSDFITLHVPKIPQTVNLINKNTISKMKHEVRIVNCARGGIVNEADIAEALTNGRIAGAALDVFDAEPISEDSPLLKLDPETAKKVVLTPHLGASTEEAQLNVAIDVAEQIRDVLNGKFARSAVNLPGFRGLDVEEIKSHLNLCVMLGKFMDQYSSGRINELNIRFRGKLSERKDLNPLALAVTKGFLSNKLENVSFVNANKLAKEKGIKVLETRSSGNCDYSEEVELKIKSDQGEFQVVGTLQSGQLPIITKLNEYSFFVPPSEHMLLTLHHDRPGVIAKISAILGKEEINISGMALSRKTERSEALMICNLDQAISENALKQIKELSEIEKSAYISL